MTRRLQPSHRGSLLIETAVAAGVIGLVAGLLVPFYIHAQRAGERMKAQARCVAAAREAASQIRRDVQASSSANASTVRLALRLRDHTVTYAHSGEAWVRRNSRASEAPIWLRDEVRGLRFSREGQAVRAEIVCAPEMSRPGQEPIRLDVLAAPRNGGGS